MSKIQKIALRILSFSFMISALSLLLGFVCKEGSMGQNVFGGVGFYGSILTINIFILHVVVLLVSKIVNAK